MKDVRRLLKRAKTGVFLLAFTTCVQAQQNTVFAGDINTEEARLLELMEQTIIQEDKTYEITDDYMAKMRYYLMQDGVDYTAEQVSQKLAKITDVTDGLAEGYLREVVVPTKGSTNSTGQGTKNNPGDVKTENNQSSEDTQQPVPDGSQTTEKEATNIGTTNTEATNTEATNTETTNKETTNKEEPTNQGTTNQGTTNQESTNQEPLQNTTKQTVTNQESTNQESTIQESSQNTTKQTTTKQETSNQHTTNQQSTPPKNLDEDTSNLIPPIDNIQDLSSSNEEATQDSNKALKGTISAQEVQKLKESVTKATRSNQEDQDSSIDVIGRMISSSGFSTTTMIAVGGGLLLLYVAGVLMAVGISRWYREKK